MQTEPAPNQMLDGCYCPAGDEYDNPEYEPAPEPDDSMDGDAESALASAGFGTDEDYGGGTHEEDFYGTED